MMVRPRGNVRWLALIAALCLAVGGLGFLFSRWLAGRNRPSVTATPEHFRSLEGLALEYRAPAGWRIEHQPKRSQLAVIEGPASARESGRVLYITAAPAGARPDVEQTLDMGRQSLTRGRDDMKVEPTRDEVVAGRPGRGFVVRSTGKAMWQAVVARGAGRVAVIQCIADNKLDPRGACAAALAGLTWLGP